MATDEALFERLCRGDMAAFDRLFARHERPLYGFIRAQLGGDADAEDVLHDAFMAVLRERERAPSMRSFRAWIYEVARHLCLNRARGRKRAAAAEEALATLPRAAEAATDERLAAARTARRIESAVDALPSQLAEIYRLRAGGMSYEEVATLLGIPIGTVKSRAHEMVRRLREELPE